MFRWVVTVIRALWKVCIPYRSRIEALYTLNSKPAVSFKSACMVRCVRLSITMSGDYREFRAVLEQAADQDFGLPMENLGHSA